MVNLPPFPGQQAEQVLCMIFPCGSSSVKGSPNARSSLWRILRVYMDRAELSA